MGLCSLDAGASASEHHQKRGDSHPTVQDARYRAQSCEHGEASSKDKE